MKLNKVSAAVNMVLANRVKENAIESLSVSPNRDFFEELGTFGLESDYSAQWRAADSRASSAEFCLDKLLENKMLIHAKDIEDDAISFWSPNSHDNMRSLIVTKPRPALHAHQQAVVDFFNSRAIFADSRII